MHARTRSGFALLEATAAVFVASVGLFGVVQMIQLTADEIRTVQEKHIAERMVRNEMEYLLALPFDALSPGAELPFRTDAPEMRHLVQARPRVDIRENAGGPETLREVTVRIEWRSTHGRLIRRSLTTLVARGVE